MKIVRTFYNAQEAFEHYYYEISNFGIDSTNTLFLLNQGFTLRHPELNEIKTDFRNWNKIYANREFEWYLSQDRSIDQIARYAPIWKDHADDHGLVNSNYGYQWSRNNQLDYVINELKRDPESRRAAISIYDGKEHADYAKDTPCTYAIGFQIVNNKLEMSVLMRSNDLWFGFCNDQYCFSELMKIVADELSIGLGSYYHFAQNFHIYKDKLDKNGLQLDF